MEKETMNYISLAIVDGNPLTDFCINISTINNLYFVLDFPFSPTHIYFHFPIAKQI